MLLLVDQTGNGQNDIRREYYHLRTIRDLLLDLRLMLIEQMGKQKRYLKQP